MKLIAIIIGKIILFFGKILNRGSSLPGKVALSIDKTILKKFIYPKVKIVVTGSSGKGSTSSLIANTLKDNGYKVCFNDAGSNLAWGITSSLIKCSTLSGKIKTDYLVLEIDERYAKEVFSCILPNYIIITNLTKDQPPRQHHIDIVYDDVLKSINKNAYIITNMDEPYLRNFAKDLPNKNIYYGINKNKYSYKDQIFENLNTYYCPYCHGLLKYEYYNFETLGKYECLNCDFKYEEPTCLGENLNLETGNLEINGMTINIGGNMLYNAYNTIAAYTTLSELKLNIKDITNSINKLNYAKDNTFTNNNKIFYPMSCKAENCTTFNQAIFKIIQDKKKKSIIIGWKEISRRYDHYDVSWLYDIEFELLNNKNTVKVYACGIDSRNIKRRLILSGLNENKIVTANTIDEIKNEVLNDDSEIVYGILNFDYVEPLEECFKEEQ